MDYYIDYSYKSINKHGEELCGDNVEVVQKKDGVILVLADGLGSGVKANILATLTSKIAVTMLKEGLSIDDVLETITNTLPVCSKRQLAYSTFTIIDMKDSGEVYMIEYENPSSFSYRLGKKFKILKKEREINGKKILESYFQMRKGDFLIVVSDGVVHAGVGELLNLGWQWENVDDYLENLVKLEDNSKSITQGLVEVCKSLYNDKAGDDTTVCALTLKERVYADLFTGPPKDANHDKEFFKKFKESKGYTIVSGGTTANIIARELGENVEIDLSTYDGTLPPAGSIKGVNLVTEGLLTLNRVVEIFRSNEKLKNCGASQIIKMLDRCTNINIHLGKAINAAHQNPDFPEEFNLKAKVVGELKKLLEEQGKIINIIEL